jgi:DNA-binding response OmpR family regulator
MKQRIAIIEDEPAILELYTIKFEKEGYEVQVAKNGIEGLRLIESFKPHLVLLDLLMPQMNGDEMLQKLRETEWGRSIKVVILTNVSRLEAPDTLNGLGISRYIVKAELTAAQVAEVVKEELAKVTVVRPHL